MMLKLENKESFKKQVFAIFGIIAVVLLIFCSAFTNHNINNNSKSPTFRSHLTQTNQAFCKQSTLSHLEYQDFWVIDKDERLDEDQHTFEKKTENIKVEKLNFISEVEKNFYVHVFIKNNPLFLLFQQLKLPY